jgi:flagellar M-ring protein FliF
MSDLFQQIGRLWKELGTNQKASLLIAGLGIIAVIGGLLFWAGRPRMQLLYGGLDGKEMGEITKAVDGLGIKYEIRNGGSAIYVNSKEVYAARMKLAADGMPSGGGVGFEIFDSGSFGISNFVQRTNYVRAIQGELSRTINQLDGVRGSKVMIVIPESELLINGPQKKPTASVFVDTGSRALPIEAVDSIRSLVSSSVEGLNPNNVSVVDNRGNVLSEALKDDGTMGASSSQIKHRKALEDYYTQKVEGMLARVVGRENVVVRVSVGLDMETQTLREEQYDPEGQVVRKENTSENTTVSTETNPAGVVGEAANVAGGTQTPGSGSTVNNSQETQKTKESSYEINRKTIETVKAPGGIRSLTASVFLALQYANNGQGVQEPKPRTEEQINSLRKMVVNAMGVEYANDEELMKKVSIAETEFSSDGAIAVETGGGMDMGSIIDMGRNVAAVVISIVMLLFFFRLVKSSANESSSMEVLNAEQAAAANNAKDATPLISPELLNELIKQSPEKVSSALKNWAFPDN